MSYLKDLAIVLWSSFLSNVSVMSKSQLFLCWPIAHKKLMVSCFLYLQKKGPICDLIKHRNQINYSYWKKLVYVYIMCNEIVILWLNALPREIFFLGKLYPLFLAIIHIGALLHLLLQLFSRLCKKIIFQTFIHISWFEIRVIIPFWKNIFILVNWLSCQSITLYLARKAINGSQHEPFIGLIDATIIKTNSTTNVKSPILIQ